MKKALIALVALMAAGSAAAKLPPPSEEAQAKAAEAKAKAAWGDKVSAYKLCLSQDKTAARYLKAKGKPAAASTCQDPGPFVATAAAPAAAPGMAAASPAKAAAPAKK